MINKRQQLTLFINPAESIEIEKIREKFNPRQLELIKAHATLCREDEIEKLERVLENLKALNLSPIAINFGNPIRFADGKGVLLPAIGENKDFHQLRKTVLHRVIDNPRKHDPHITLMHPRNSVCTDEIFEQINSANFTTKLTFDTISLIEQQGSLNWNVLEEFRL